MHAALPRRPIQSRHPVWLQRWGASLSLGVFVLVSLGVPALRLPVWVQFWRSGGLALPLYGAHIWYLARGQDVLLCPVYSTQPFRLLGEAAYSAYLLQQAVTTLLHRHDPAFASRGYVPTWWLLPWLFLTAMAAQRLVQRPAQRALLARLRALRSNPWAQAAYQGVVGAADCRTGVALASLGGVWLYVHYSNSACFPHDRTPMHQHAFITTNDIK